MIVLADTSVWIDHWRRGNRRFEELLDADRVVVHPFVLGELALGAVTPRATVLQHLGALRVPRVAHQDELMGLIERTHLWRRGIGWVDVHLLASAMLDQIRLWTLDHALGNVAKDLDLALPDV